MKKLFYFLLPFLLAIVAIVFAYALMEKMESPGYVLIAIGHDSYETTFVVLATALMISFFTLYIVFRFLGYVIRLPGNLSRRGKSIKFNRSQEALIAGLVDSAEGNFEKAESVLIKHASHSGAPLLHYLTAARAAQSRGAFDKRDEYLRKAQEQSPDANVAIGLTQAELHLSGNQFEQAIETLTRLHSIEPTHASVLKLLHQTYQHLGNWDAIRKLIPSLNTHKVLLETEAKLLEAEAFSKLLKQAAKQGNIEEVELLWSEMPPHVKAMHGIPAIYFAAMIEMGAGTDIEEELVSLLSSNFNDTLLVLYGDIKAEDPVKQLETAQEWNEIHHDNPVLLTVLGKLSLQCNYSESAERYLLKSIGIEPTVQAYQLLGDLFFTQDDKDRASQYYKLGLELASSELVTRMDSVTE